MTIMTGHALGSLSHSEQHFPLSLPLPSSSLHSKLQGSQRELGWANSEWDCSGSLILIPHNPESKRTGVETLKEAKHMWPLSETLDFYRHCWCFWLRCRSRGIKNTFKILFLGCRRVFFLYSTKHLWVMTLFWGAKFYLLSLHTKCVGEPFFPSVAHTPSFFFQFSHVP